MTAWVDRLRLGQVVDAWRVRQVQLGFLGTLLIAVGSLTPAYLPRSSPWWRLLRQLHLDNTVAKVVGTGLSLTGLACLVLAWFLLRPWGDAHQGAGSAAGSKDAPPERLAAYHHLRHWAILAIWGLPLLVAPPIYSHDAYSYAAQGWLVHNGISPYEAGPGLLPGDFANQVAWVWRYTPAPYGPLSLQIQHLLVDASGYDAYLSALLMRVPALVGVVLIGLLVPRIAGLMKVDAAFAAWFGTLNPVLVIDFIGGAHNDALMMGLVVLALWVALRWRHGWWAGAVIVGTAAAIKQPAFLAAYALPLLGHQWRRWRFRDVTVVVGRAVASIVVAVGTFVAISYATGLDFGWYNAVGVPGLVVTVSPFTVVGQALRWVFEQAGAGWAVNLVRWFRAAGLVISGLTIVALALTVARRRPVTFLSWSYLAVAFCGPALHSWYMLWGGLLLPLTRPSTKVVRAAVWTTLFLLSYSAMILSWRNGTIALGVAALVGYLWLTWTHDRLPLPRWLKRERPAEGA